jgi:hypothetical protein
VISLAKAKKINDQITKVFEELLEEYFHATELLVPSDSSSSERKTTTVCLEH